MTTYPDEATYTPARVHIVADDTKEAPSVRQFINVVSKTYLAGTTPELILPRATKRRGATITVIGVAPTQGNIILCDNEADAQAAVTYGATTAQTLAGLAMGPGMFIYTRHNDEVWLVRLGSAGTAPLVGVQIEIET